MSDSATERLNRWAAEPDHDVRPMEEFFLPRDDPDPVPGLGASLEELESWMRRNNAAWREEQYEKRDAEYNALREKRQEVVDRAFTPKPPSALEEYVALPIGEAAHGAADKLMGPELREAMRFYTGSDEYDPEGTKYPTPLERLEGGAMVGAMGFIAPFAVSDKVSQKYKEVRENVELPTAVHGAGVAAETMGEFFHKIFGEPGEFRAKQEVGKWSREFEEIFHKRHGRNPTSKEMKHALRLGDEEIRNRQAGQRLKHMALGGAALGGGMAATRRVVPHTAKVVGRRGLDALKTEYEYRTTPPLDRTGAPTLIVEPYKEGGPRYHTPDMQGGRHWTRYGKEMPLVRTPRDPLGPPPPAGRPPGVVVPPTQTGPVAALPALPVPQPPGQPPQVRGALPHTPPPRGLPDSGTRIPDPPGEILPEFPRQSEYGVPASGERGRTISNEARQRYELGQVPLTPPGSAPLTPPPQFPVAPSGEQGALFPQERLSGDTWLGEAEARTSSVSGVDIEPLSPKARGAYDLIDDPDSTLQDWKYHRISDMPVEEVQDLYRRWLEKGASPPGVTEALEFEIQRRAAETPEARLVDFTRRVEAIKKGFEKPSPPTKQGQQGELPFGLGDSSGGEGLVREAIPPGHSPEELFRVAYRAARSAGARHHDAEDAAQNAVLALMNRGSEVPKPFGWIKTVARRQLIDEQARQSKQATPTDKDILEREASRDLSDPRQRAQRELHDRVLRDLDGPVQDAALQVWIVGESLTEYARSRGINYNAAKTRVNRAKEQLRKAADPEWTKHRRRARDSGRRVWVKRRGGPESGSVRMPTPEEWKEWFGSAGDAAKRAAAASKKYLYERVGKDFKDIWDGVAEAYRNQAIIDKDQSAFKRAMQHADYSRRTTLLRAIDAVPATLEKAGEIPVTALNRYLRKRWAKQGPFEWLSGVMHMRPWYENVRNLADPGGIMVSPEWADLRRRVMGMEAEGRDVTDLVLEQVLETINKDYAGMSSADQAAIVRYMGNVDQAGPAPKLPAHLARTLPFVDAINTEIKALMKLGVELGFTEPETHAQWRHGRVERPRKRRGRKRLAGKFGIEQDWLRPDSPTVTTNLPREMVEAIAPRHHVPAPDEAPHPNTRRNIAGPRGGETKVKFWDEKSAREFKKQLEDYRDELQKEWLAKKESSQAAYRARARAKKLGEPQPPLPEPPGQNPLFEVSYDDPVSYEQRLADGEIMDDWALTTVATLTKLQNRAVAGTLLRGMLEGGDAKGKWMLTPKEYEDLKAKDPKKAERYEPLAKDHHIRQVRNKYIRNDIRSGWESDTHQKRNAIRHDDASHLLRVFDHGFSFFQGMQNAFKVNKTLLSPRTALRQLPGNLIFTVNAGNSMLNPFNWWSYYDAAKIVLNRKHPRHREMVRSMNRGAEFAGTDAQIMGDIMRGMEGVDQADPNWTFQLGQAIAGSMTGVGNTASAIGDMLLEPGRPRTSKVEGETGPAADAPPPIGAVRAGFGRGFKATGDVLSTVGGTIEKWAGRFYNLFDAWVKIAAALKNERIRRIKPEEGIMDVERAIPSYPTASPWARVSASLPVAGTSFGRFDHLTRWAQQRTAVNHPFRAYISATLNNKMKKWALYLMGGGGTALGLAMEGMEALKGEPDPNWFEQAGGARFIPAGYDDEGYPLILDTTQLDPLSSQWLSGQRGFNSSPIEPTILAKMREGLEMFGVTEAIGYSVGMRLGNTDPRTGEPIMKPGMTTSEALGTWIQQTARELMPGLTPFVGKDWDKVVNPRGDNTQTPNQRAMDAFLGLTFRRFDATREIQWIQWAQKKAIDDVVTDASRDINALPERKGKEAKRLEIRDAAIARKNRIIDQAKDLIAQLRAAEEAISEMRGEETVAPGVLDTTPQPPSYINPSSPEAPTLVR